MKKIILPILLLLSGSLLHAQFDASRMRINNVKVVDVETGKAKTTTVHLQDGKIVRLGGEKMPEPEGELQVDGSGKYLIPGLVDAHIHLFQTGGLYTRPDAIDLQHYRPYPVERQWAKENAPNFLQRYLAAGITSVIDMGGPFFNYAVRDSFSDPSAYPNLYLTGPLISTYQPEAFEIEDAPILKVENAEEAVELVRRQLPYRPDFIKIWYIARKPEDADESYPIVEATIKESHAKGLRVAVHATELYTAKLAIRAGADILVHSVDDPIDQEFIDMVLEKNVAYVPTLVVHGNYIKSFRQERDFSAEDFNLSHPIPLGHLLDPHHLVEDPRVAGYKEFADGRVASLHEMDSIRLDNLKRMSKAGAWVATGTDAGNIGTLHASSYYDELAYMQQSGMDNAEILRASTIAGARILGKDDVEGKVAVGYKSDLLLLNSNPLKDIMAVKDIFGIVKGTRMYEPKDLISHTPEELAQQQLNAYNCGDIEAFLAPYSEDVELYNFPDELTTKGKEKMRPGYAGMFKQLPNLHCELVQRDVLGNTVIDHERITGIPGQEPFEAIAIYKIEDGKIAKVYFIR